MQSIETIMQKQWYAIGSDEVSTLILSSEVQLKTKANQQPRRQMPRQDLHEKLQITI